MKELEALEIIRALADGIDPHTGEVFPADSTYQNAQTTRALFAAIDALKAAARRKNMPERAGQLWDDQESNLLIKRFEEGLPISEIAKEHKRTTGAINSQLKKACP